MPPAPTTQELGTALKRARKAAGFSNAHAFLAAMREVGTAPSYSTYAQWESGEVAPREESLAPVRRFHEARGTWVETQGAPDLATALLELSRELKVAREERALYLNVIEQLTQIADLRAEVSARGQEAAEERTAQAELLGRLAADVAELRTLAGTQAGSGHSGPANRN